VEFEELNKLKNDVNYLMNLHKFAFITIAIVGAFWILNKK
jgi:hypothetical protein